MRTRGNASFDVRRWYEVKGELLRSVVRDRFGAPTANPAFGAAPAAFNALVAFNARELLTVTHDEVLADRRHGAGSLALGTMGGAADDMGRRWAGRVHHGRNTRARRTVADVGATSSRPDGVGGGGRRHGVRRPLRSRRRASRRALLRSPSVLAGSGVAAAHVSPLVRSRARRARPHRPWSGVRSRQGCREHLASRSTGTRTTASGWARGLSRGRPWRSSPLLRRAEEVLGQRRVLGDPSEVVVRVHRLAYVDDLPVRRARCGGAFVVRDPHLAGEVAVSIRWFRGSGTVSRMDQSAASAPFGSFGSREDPARLPSPFTNRPSAPTTTDTIDRSASGRWIRMR